MENNPLRADFPCQLFVLHNVHSFCVISRKTGRRLRPAAAEEKRLIRNEKSIVFHRRFPFGENESNKEERD